MFLKWSQKEPFPNFLFIQGHPKTEPPSLGQPKCTILLAPHLRQEWVCVGCFPCLPSHCWKTAKQTRTLSLGVLKLEAVSWVFWHQKTYSGCGCSPNHPAGLVAKTTTTSRQFLGGKRKFLGGVGSCSGMRRAS